MTKGIEIDNTECMWGRSFKFLILFGLIAAFVGCSSKQKSEDYGPSVMDFKAVEPALDRQTIRAEIQLIDSEISNIDSQINSAQNRASHIMPGFEGMKHGAEKEIKDLRKQKSQLSSRREFLKSQLYQNQ